MVASLGSILGSLGAKRVQKGQNCPDGHIMPHFAVLYLPWWQTGLEFTCPTDAGQLKKAALQGEEIWERRDRHLSNMMPRFLADSNALIVPEAIWMGNNEGV